MVSSASSISTQSPRQASSRRFLAAAKSFAHGAWSTRAPFASAIATVRRASPYRGRPHLEGYAAGAVDGAADVRLFIAREDGDGEARSIDHYWSTA